MGALSGKYAQAIVDSCDIAEFESWELDEGAETLIYHSRSGAGYQKTEEGPGGGTGTLVLFFDPADPVAGRLVSGGLYTVALYQTATGPVQHTGTIRLGKFRYGGDRNGPLQKVTIPFATHGPWVQPS